MGVGWKWVEITLFPRDGSWRLVCWPWHWHWHWHRSDAQRTRTFVVSTNVARAMPLCCPSKRNLVGKRGQTGDTTQRGDRDRAKFPVEQLNPSSLVQLIICYRIRNCLAPHSGILGFRQADRSVHAEGTSDRQGVLLSPAALSTPIIIPMHGSCTI